MLAWFGMLITQPFLIRAGRRTQHRALGKVSYVLVPLIALATISLAPPGCKSSGGGPTGRSRLGCFSYGSPGASTRSTIATTPDMSCANLVSISMV